MITTIGMFAALVGFCISLYIYAKQYGRKPLMCPRKAPCETVINSPQSMTFGISNSELGMVFYFAAFFLFWCLSVGGGSAIVETLLLILTIGGFAFSIYLVRVQRNIIKQWCIWCLGSAAVATVLFIIAIVIQF